MGEIDSFITRGTLEPEPEVEQNRSVDIPDSYDPSLRFEELQVQSQSKTSGPKDELASFRQFGITRFYDCKY